MLGERTLKWLEARKNLCSHCGRRQYCRLGNRHGFNTEHCIKWEAYAPGYNGMVHHDYQDAAIFEARVVIEQVENISYIRCDSCQYHAKHRCYQSGEDHGKMPWRWCRLKMLRLEAERSLDRGNKGGF